jgi:hypothetical protein
MSQSGASAWGLLFGESFFRVGLDTSGVLMNSPARKNEYTGIAFRRFGFTTGRQSSKRRAPKGAGPCERRGASRKAVELG